MRQIFTVTLNPAFDLHYRMERFEAGKENYVQSILCDAGGKGVNISRALATNGVVNTAFVVLGEENGASFEARLRHGGITYQPFYTPGRIRENITLHPENDRETRISLDTFQISGDVLEELEAKLTAVCRPGDFTAFAGRNPRGAEKQDVIAFLQRRIADGIHVAVDSNSFTPEDLKMIHPWLIKPNEQEIDAFLGRSVKTLEEAAEAARLLVSGGIAEQVMISLGGDGAAWSNGREARMIRVPRLEHPVSTIGAGDSTVAGYLAAAAEGLPIDRILQTAVAFGTAACMTPGTLPPKPEDVRRIAGQVIIE